MDKPPAVIDSNVFGQRFFGILNKGGDFWTPLAFDGEAEAYAHIDRFWGPSENRTRFLAECRIVPVQIILTELKDHPHD